MAQVLKDEIQENILKAALQEFYEKEYKSAAMCEIASKAKIPTGLIYSYYKNKESLFNAVLYPVLYDWERMLTTKDNGHSEEIYELSKVETECLLNLFEHRREWIILFDKSEGTQYEQEKNRFIEAIEQHLNKHKKDIDTNGIFIHIIANNFVGGFFMMSLLVQMLIKNKDEVLNPNLKRAYAILSSVVGIMLNLFLCVAKIVIGLLSHSVSISADGFNNLSDARTNLVSLLGFKIARYGGGSTHSFGHGRIEWIMGIFASSVVLLMG